MEQFDPSSEALKYLGFRRKGIFFPPEWEDVITIEQAYALQLALLDRQLECGNRQLGWKVGLTAAAIQQQFDVHEPGFGFLMDTAPYPTRASIPFDELEKPGFENELCIVVGSRLRGPNIDYDQAASAITSVTPAFELVETRGDSHGSLVKGILDNLQQRAIIFGDKSQFERSVDLAEVRVSVYINGAHVDSGFGSAVLGNPIKSVAWLANKLSQFGREISAGDCVMTGSFTRQFPIGKGDRIRSDFTEFGTVEAYFP